ncbi:MAG: hypothetical protein HYY40_10660 [Bacteroidetes bacterium]|nr:hypothetical protein [Bacteroidota bacterium]
MRKLIVKIIAFNIPVLIIAALLSRFDNLLFKVKNDNIIRINEALHYNDPDYLFVGSSIAYSSIIPAFFDSINIRSYNLGIATAGPYFMEIILDDFLNAAKKKPENVVMEISLLTFSDGSDDWVRYPVHRYLNRPLSNEYIAWHYGNLPLYLNMMRKSLVKGTRNIFEKTVYKNYDEYPYDTIALEEVVKNRGFYPSNEALNDSVYRWQAALMKDYPGKSFLPEKQQKLFRIIEKLQRAGCRVIIIEVPNSEFEHFFNVTYKNEYDNLLKTLSQTDNVTFIRQPPDAEGEYSFSEMRNITHLNTTGAKKFTKYLLKKLGELN